MTEPENREPKRYRTGTHRTAPPVETLARVRPLLGKMGITRVANITGLDRTGIPVAMAVRPNSRSVSVSQGKGLEIAAAKASAVMEAAETWHAERIARPLRFAPAAELRAEGLALADLEGLPRVRRETFSAETPIFWIEALDLLSDTPTWLPLELVSSDYTLPQPPGSGWFAANTNGLASGNTRREAICHAICEVVERDADALWRQRPVRGQRARGIDPATIDDPDCRALLERFGRAGLEVRVWDVTSDAGIAACVCLAAGDEEDWADPEFGAGCHPAREIALSRALTEAAQARTTFIAGARDDIGAALYRPALRRARRRHCREILARHQPARSFREVPTTNHDTMERDLAWSLGRLQAIGIRQVLAVDLTRPAIGLPVAKVVIPGLEGAYGHSGERYVPGRRAQRILARPAELTT